MSLINDVLRDLEQRRQGSLPRHPGGVRPARSAFPSWPLWLIAAALVGGVLHWIVSEQPTGETSQPVLVASSEEVRPADRQAAAIEPLEQPPAESSEAEIAKTTSDPTETTSAEPARIAQVPRPEAEPDTANAAGGAHTKPSSALANAESDQQSESTSGTRQPAQAQAPDSPPVQSGIRIERAAKPEAPGQDRLDDARRAFARGHFGLAESQAKALVSEHPQLTDGHLLLARALLRQGRARSAIEALDRALTLADAPARPAALLGRALVERGETARARSVLEQHKPEPMSDPDYHLLLAATQHQAGDHEAAAGTYRRLGDIIPGNARVWIGLGASLESLERFEEALNAYERALEGRDPRAARYARQRIEQLK